MKTKLHTLVTCLWLLSLAILLTIYLAWLVYPLENHWLKLADLVYMKDRQLYANFNHLMRYLTLPWVTELKMPDFRSSKDGLAHFRDVEHLFHLAQVVFLVGLWPAFKFFKDHRKHTSLWLYRKLWLSLAILPVLIALVGFLIGFDQFFTLFHQILFPGATNWLFNPYTDPVIWVLPESYFLHCFILFFLIYEGLMLGLWWQSRRSYQNYQKKAED